MNFNQFKTGPDDLNRRLDKVVRMFDENMSLAEIYKGIRKGLIRINNKKTKAEYRIQENDVIFIADFLLKNEEKQQDLPKPYSNYDKMPEIVFENEHILIINKPYNVNVHGDETSLDKIVESYYNRKNLKSSLSFRPGPLHRLDKKTTGLLAFSMSLEGARWFSENIKNHKIQKKYYGLVEGSISEKQQWHDIISNNENTNKSGFHKVSAKIIADKNEKEIKNPLKKDSPQKDKIAETTVTPIEQGFYNGKNLTLVEFHIKTGRKHQIRAQSALHNHPLAGDTAYGGKKLPFGTQDFYLTARELIIPKENPIGLPEKLKVMLPKDFIDVLKRCGIKKIGV